mgnify:CR=1 FL=1
MNSRINENQISPILSETSIIISAKVIRTCFCSYLDVSELGVPVSFAAINHFCAICEMSDSEVGYMPELSYGSHMFQDLVEAEIFYTALFDTPKTRIFNRTVFHDMPNILTEILPDCKEYEDIVKVCHTEGMHLKLYSDVQNSETVLGFES